MFSCMLIDYVLLVVFANKLASSLHLLVVYRILPQGQKKFNVLCFTDKKLFFILARKFVSTSKVVGIFVVIFWAE